MKLTFKEKARLNWLIFKAKFKKLSKWVAIFTVFCAISYVLDGKAERFAIISPVTNTLFTGAISFFILNTVLAIFATVFGKKEKKVIKKFKNDATETDRKDGFEELE